MTSSNKLYFHSLIITITVMLSLFSSPSKGATHLSIPDCEGHLLSSKQLEVLSNASTYDYIVRVMEGEINGIKRTVVLLGEYHIKDKKADLLGKNVVDQFSVVGYETTLSSYEFLAGYLSMKMTKIYRVFHQFLYRMKGSTITYAREQAQIEKANLIHLEKGHQFTPSEKRKTWVFVADSGLQVSLAAAAIGSAMAIVIGVTNLQPDTAIFGFIGCSTTMLADILLTKAKQWFRYDDFSKSVLCPSRDDSMVANIQTTFEQRADIKKLLAIEGQGHVPGMIERLEQKGFKSVEINTAEQKITMPK